MIRKNIISFFGYSLTAILNSYGLLFFSRNFIFSILILIVTFFIPVAGMAGLASVLISVITAHAIGFDKEHIRSGLLTYSALLFGLGFATNFETGLAFTLLLIIGSILTLFISVVLSSKLGTNNLPALSLGFIFSTWVIILASKDLSALGLTQRHIYWFNETYTIGGQRLVNLVQTIENWSMPVYMAGFFRSMSAILFQINIASGILLSIGLLIYSRIALLLMILGYAVAIAFNQLMGGFDAGDMTYYNMGTNFMLVALALGGFYLIPSVRSFLWVFITVPIAFLLVIGLGHITFAFGLPVFSLPFCIVVILFLYTLQLRKKNGKLVLTPIQYYNPEINLYRYLNGRERLMNQYYFRFSLPFMGEWMVSQGYDGSMTHKGDWSKALDFVILDQEMKTYSDPGNQPEHFYCYNKPVLSPADGIVEEIADHIDDNIIGKNNTEQNWGNSIVIKHADGLYSKLSHLKKNSFKVTKGEYVRKGDIIALCGNSGRSPEPHLHFQIQSTPYIGSKTIVYPLSYFYSREDNEIKLKNFSTPAEGRFVSNVTPNPSLQQAFAFLPGYCMQVSAEGYVTEEWEVFTNIANESYIYCKKHDVYAYFISNGTVFYFTNYFGKHDTLLYQFYLAAYKVLLSSEKDITVNDSYPLNVFVFHPLRWLQDMVSPFFIFMRMNYESAVKKDNSLLPATEIRFSSRQEQNLFGIRKHQMSASVTVENGRIRSFVVQQKNKNIKAICTEEY